MPAVLIEYGFHTNREEAALLGSGEYRTKLADLTAKGILNYFGMEIGGGTETDDKYLAARKSLLITLGRNSHRHGGKNYKEVNKMDITSLGITSVASITAICFLICEVAKRRRLTKNGSPLSPAYQEPCSESLLSISCRSIRRATT
jgi:hypothetical protein